MFPVNNVDECRVALKKLIDDDEYRGSISYALKEFMKNHTGATDIIVSEVTKNRWLD